MGDSQIYIIENQLPYNEHRVTQYTASLLDIGLSSGSNIDGTVFDSHLEDGYHFSSSVDDDRVTFTLLHSRDPAKPGHTGIDIDLRQSSEVTHSLSAASFSVHIPDGSSQGFYATAFATNTSNLFDNDATTDSTLSLVRGSNPYGWITDLGEGIRLSSFDIAAGDSKTVHGYTASISFNGTDFIEDSRFDLTTANQVETIDIHYRSGSAAAVSESINDGQQRKGNLDSKKVKKLKIEGTDGESAGAHSIRNFGTFNVNKIEYENPEGVYLQNVRLKATFGNPGSGQWQYQVSYDGDNFVSVGENPFKNDYADEIFTGDLSVYTDQFSNKAKIFRLINTQSAAAGGSGPNASERIFGAFPTQSGELAGIVISTYDATIFNNMETNFEFNDSVLETKGWNSSRYDGRQLSTRQINRATKDDIGNNDRTPIIQKYSRNIYIGNDIVSIDTNNVEDEGLLTVDNFSYIQSNNYITVNEDGSITNNTLEEKSGDVSSKIGFYQSFYDDFPLGSGCNLIVFDQKAKNNAKPTYTVYFNGGQFQRLFRYINAFPSPGNVNYYTGSSTSSQQDDSAINILEFEQASPVGGIGPDGIRSNFVIENAELFNEFFVDKSKGLVSTAQTPFEPEDDFRLNSHLFAKSFKESVFDTAFERKTTSGYTGDKRLFITFLESASAGVSNTSLSDELRLLGTPIRTIGSGSTLDATNPLRTKNLAEISTGEIISTKLFDLVGTSNALGGSGEETASLRLQVSDKTPLNFNYSTKGSSADGGIDDLAPFPFKADNTHIMFSQTNDNVPSLLVNLPKSKELPQGVGDLPFVILPDNIHPYIKDNLALFLSRAGINVSDDATQAIKEVKSNKPKQPKLGYFERLAQNRRRSRPLTAEERALRILEIERRRKEFLLKSRSGRKKLKQEERQKRREKRQENRQENRQERREDRRENRQDRKENRQNRRENRRNRRRRR